MKTIEELDSEVAKLKVDCARAELRARDLENFYVKWAEANPSSHHGCEWHAGTVCEKCGWTDPFISYPDSDERLREVMFRVVEATDEVWRSKTTKTALEIVNEVLGVKS